MAKLYFWDVRTLVHLAALTRDAEVFPGIGLESPNNALRKAPMDAPEGKVVVVDDSRTKWKVVDDFRGTVYEKATREEREWDMPGALPAELTAVEPQPMQVWSEQGWVIDIEQLRASRIRAVQHGYTERLAAGFVFQGKTIEADESSQGKITGSASMALIAGNAGAEFAREWVCADNSRLQLDAAGMIALCVACGEFVALCFYRQREHKDALLAAETLDAINAVDIAGWFL